jgi:O-antigen ligase
MLIQNPKAIKISTYLAAAVILLLPLYYVRFTLFRIPTNLLEIMILVSACVTAASLPKEKLTQSFPYLLPVVLILIGLASASWFAFDKRVALGIIKGWFVIPIIYAWVLTQTLDKKTLPLFINALYINVVLVGLYTILQYLMVIPLLPYQLTDPSLLQYADQGRALAFFESPNFIAMYLIPPVVFLGIYFYPNWQKLVFLLSPMAAIYLSRSRAGFITLFLLAVLVIMYYLLKRKRIYAVLGGLVGILILGYYLKLNINFEGADTLRLAIWNVAVSLISQHPLLGIGPGQFHEYFRQTTLLTPGLYQAALPYALHPHNIIFSLWLSGGLLAVVGFGILIFEVVRRLIRAKSNKTSFIAFAAGWAALAILIHGMFDSTYFKNDLAILAWFFLIIIAVFSVAESSE